MAKRIIDSDQPDNDFYEAIQTAERRPVYIEPDYDRTSLSGWAILGLILLGLVILLLLFGRGGVFGPTLSVPTTTHSAQ